MSVSILLLLDLMHVSVFWIFAEAEATSNPKRYFDREHIKPVAYFIEELSTRGCKFEGDIRVRTFWIINETSEFLF